MPSSRPRKERRDASNGDPVPYEDRSESIVGGWFRRSPLVESKRRIITLPDFISSTMDSAPRCAPGHNRTERHKRRRGGTNLSCEGAPEAVVASLVRLQVDRTETPQILVHGRDARARTRNIRAARGGLPFRAMIMTWDGGIPRRREQGAAPSHRCLKIPGSPICGRSHAAIFTHPQSEPKGMIGLFDQPPLHRGRAPFARHPVRFRISQPHVKLAQEKTPARPSSCTPRGRRHELDHQRRRRERLPR